jgi:hypothetical protein
MNIVKLLRKRATGAAPSPLLTDLVAYWKLDDLTWSDSVGSNDLANNGSVVVGTPKLGAGSAQFDGSNFLSLASNPHVQIDGDFTVACWVRFGVLDGSRQIIIGKDANSSREYVLYIDTGDVIRWQVRASVSNGLVTSSVAPAPNTWYFLVATHNSASNTQTLTVNASTTNSGTTAGTINTGNAEFQVGAREFVGFENLISNGSRIDEVGIWKRLLTSGEISDLYNGGAGITYPFS